MNHLRMPIYHFVIAALIITFWLCSCSVTREVIMPDQTIYTIKAQKDDMVTFKQGDIEIMVDGRGRPGIIEQALGIMFMNLPDVEIGTGD